MLSRHSPCKKSFNGEARAQSVASFGTCTAHLAPLPPGLSTFRPALVGCPIASPITCKAGVFVLTQHAAQAGLAPFSILRCFGVLVHDYR